LTGGLKGTEISVQPFHLFRYRDEQVFRFNHRKPDDSGRFLLAVESIVRSSGSTTNWWSGTRSPMG